MKTCIEVKEELIGLGFKEIRSSREICGFVFCVYSKKNSYYGDNIQFLGMEGPLLWRFMYREDMDEFYYWKGAEWVVIEETRDIPTMIALYK